MNTSNSHQLNSGTQIVGYKWSRWRKFMHRWKLFLYLDYSIRAKRRMTSNKRGERELKILHKLIDPNRATIDVGANKGVYTYWLEKYSTKVYAYEANKILVETFIKEPRGNVEVRPYGVSNKTGEMTFRIPIGGLQEDANKKDPYLQHQGGNFRDDPKGDVHEIKVPTYRLDDLEHDPVGYIKIDVEGLQMEVIEGAQGLIKRDQPIMMVEFVQEFHNEPIFDLIARVEQMIGYTAQVLLPTEMEHPTKVASFYFDGGHPQYIKNIFFFPNESDKLGQSYHE